METIGLGWFWLITGLSLVLLEFMIPGIFCIWLGSAAFLTSLITWILGLSFKGSLLCFSFLAFASIGLGYRLSVSRNTKELCDASLLNAHDHELIGQVFLLKDAIHEGTGTIQVHDTLWRVHGQDLPKGTKIRVLSRTGNLLIVEPAEK